VLGTGRHRNLYFNAGHGHMGWTMAFGTARIVADLGAGRKPGHDITGLWARAVAGGRWGGGHRGSACGPHAGRSGATARTESLGASQALPLLTHATHDEYDDARGDPRLAGEPL